MFSKSAALVAAAICLAGAVPCVADDQGTACPASTSVEVARVSKYVWHGLVLNPDPAIQPSITFNNGSGASFNVWGSLDTTDRVGESGSFTELDYSAGYSWKSACGLPLCAKVMYLTFPNRPGDPFWRLIGTTSLKAPFNPTLTVKYDFGDADGACATLGVSHNVPFTGATPLNFSAQVSGATNGFTGTYFGKSKSTLTDVLATLSAPSKSGPMTVTTSLSYAYILDDDLAQTVGDRKHWVFSVTGSAAF